MMLSSGMMTPSCIIAVMAKSEVARPDAGIEAASPAEIEIGTRVEGGLEEALPLGPQPLPELIEFRHIDDAATMKAFADPLRMKIMRVLEKHVHTDPRIMTVKQIAEELGEPTTKLYRHIKQLLAVDLIQVAELRLVGGIVEQRYRVAQKALGINPSRPEMRETLMSEEMFGVFGAAIDEFFELYESALRSGRTYLRPQDSLDNPPHVRPVGAIADFRVPREKAVEFAERFHALVKEFTGQPDKHAEDGVNVNLLAMFYATEPED
jgi:DNA-binding transcriptional ArsR family regulator